MTRECSVEIRAAPCWSSQNPGAPMAPRARLAGRQRIGVKGTHEPSRAGLRAPRARAREVDSPGRPRGDGSCAASERAQAGRLEACQRGQRRVTAEWSLRRNRPFPAPGAALSVHRPEGIVRTHPRDLARAGRLQRRQPGSREAGCHRPGAARDARQRGSAHAPWQRLNFLPLPHQQGSLRPTFALLVLTTWRWTRGSRRRPSPARGPPPAAAITSAPYEVSCS